MRRIVFIAFLICSLSPFAFSQDKEKSKGNDEQKQIDKEEQRFQKQLKHNPDDPDVYIEHAEKLASFKSTYQLAQYYYVKALKMDSSKYSYYKSYGKYLYERLYQIDTAWAILNRGLKISAADAEMKSTYLAVTNAIKQRETENRLRDVGTLSKREYYSVTYSALSNFDSLLKILYDTTNKKCYDTLLKRFLADDGNLTPEDMYFLIVGYSKQPDYTPFNYNDINELKRITSMNFDTALVRGNELIKKNPLNPTLNREMMYIYRKKNNRSLADKYSDRVIRFYNGILYSGDGSCDKPYISLWAKEDYNFIKYLDCQTTDKYSMGTCAGQMAEIFEVVNSNTMEKEKIHFNAKLIYLRTVGK